MGLKHPYSLATEQFCLTSFIVMIVLRFDEAFRKIKEADL